MTMCSWRRVLLFCLLIWQAPLVAQPMQTFAPGSLEGIVQAHKHSPLLVVFWSGECPPCMAELKMLAQHPAQGAYRLVLVSVDGIASSDESLATLNALGFHSVEMWAFGDGVMPARVFYFVDPSWQGELPRSEFFSPDGRRFHHIGKLTRAQIDHWVRMLH